MAGSRGKRDLQALIGGVAGFRAVIGPVEVRAARGDDFTVRRRATPRVGVAAPRRAVGPVELDADGAAANINTTADRARKVPSQRRRVGEDRPRRRDSAISAPPPPPGPGPRWGTAGAAVDRVAVERVLAVARVVSGDDGVGQVGGQQPAARTATSSKRAPGHPPRAARAPRPRAPPSHLLQPSNERPGGRARPGVAPASRESGRGPHRHSIPGTTRTPRAPPARDRRGHSRKRVVVGDREHADASSRAPPRSAPRARARRKRRRCGGRPPPGGCALTASRRGRGPFQNRQDAPGAPAADSSSVRMCTSGVGGASSRGHRRR